MSVSVQPIKVVGVQQAMLELASIDKRALKGFQNEYKQIVMPMLQEAKYAVPAKAPMSGWNRSWTPRSANTWRISERLGLLPWMGNAKNDIKPFINYRKKRRYTSGNYSSGVAFGIRWTSKSAVLFDMTGKGTPSTPQGNRMMDVLGQRYGGPSRTMWRAYERAGDDVQREMVKLINKIMKATGRNIKTRRR
jgi:hypothetical protein